MLCHPSTCILVSSPDPPSTLQEERGSGGGSGNETTCIPVGQGLYIQFTEPFTWQGLACETIRHIE